MSSSTLTIPIDPETAKLYERASREDQRKIQLLLSLRVRDLTTAPLPPLGTIMDELADKAQARGLTPEIVGSLLKGQ